MKTLEQNHQPSGQEEKMVESTEKKAEELKPILEILKRVAKEFRDLEPATRLNIPDKREEGIGSPANRKEVRRWHEALRKRGRLIASFPELLSNDLDNVADLETQQVIRFYINKMAAKAQNALDDSYKDPSDSFLLGVLLTPKGMGKEGDRNTLEQFIYILENKGVSGL